MRVAGWLAAPVGGLAVIVHLQRLSRLDVGLDGERALSFPDPIL